jgi:hypothetical protein
MRFENKGELTLQIPSPTREYQANVKDFELHVSGAIESSGGSWDFGHVH